MISLTEEGFQRFSTEDLQDGIHVLLKVIFDFELNNWDYNPTYYYWNGQLCKEKYELTNKVDDELLRKINSIDDLVEHFPYMYKREMGDEAVRAFPITREIMQEAIDAGYIYIY
jgi:hypothetical protein